jgi:hypothetical protein
MGSVMRITYVPLSFNRMVPKIQVEPVLRHHVISLCLKRKSTLIQPKSPRRCSAAHLEDVMLRTLMSRGLLHGETLAYVAIHSAPICGKQVSKDRAYSLLFASIRKSWTLLSYMLRKSAFTPSD